MGKVNLPEPGTKTKFTALTSRNSEWVILRGRLGTSDDGEKIETAVIFPSHHDDNSPKLERAIKNYCKRSERNILDTNKTMKKKYGAFIAQGKFRNFTVTLPEDCFEDEGIYDTEFDTWSVGASEILEDKVGQMLVKKSIALAESQNNSGDEDEDDED